MKRATIYDVAGAAGVSTSTVSLALNNPARVSADTLQKVMRAVDLLRYVPKSEVVTRARRGVRRIGVIAPFTSFPSFALRLNGILRRARSNQYEVVVYDQDSAATSRLVSLPIAGHIDGLIVLSVPVSDDVAARLADQQIPTVLVELTRAGFSSVTIDDAGGGTMVAKLFAGHGHTRVGFLGATQTVSYLSQSQQRLAGFQSALSEEPEVRLVAESFDGAYAGACELLDSGVTAIFAHHDLLASAALKAARDRDLAVPEQLEIVGFDDGELAQSLGLTTVHQPFFESGEVAADLLIGAIEQSQRSARSVTLELELVERGTTTAARGSQLATARVVEA
jgi:DNA-binding LacI/PurR family transcriptional regulator